MAENRDHQPYDILRHHVIPAVKVELVAAGAAGVIVGKKIITAKKTRQLAVTGLAKGMKLTSDAKSAFQSMKDEAQDLCYEAKEQAGLNANADNAEESED